MKFTAQQIATVVQGIVEGNPHSEVHSLAKIEEASAGDLCFLANSKYEHYLYTTQASIILVNESLQLEKEVECTLIRVKDPYAAFATLLQTYQDIIGNNHPTGTEPNAHIQASATIADGVYIGAFSYISDNARIASNAKIYPNAFIGKNVSIGENSIIFPGVTIYNDCVIGKNVIIHAGAVIGSDGFGFALENGSFKKIPQLGNVIIEDEVEVGANTTIDRATLGSTIIRKGVKLDNLIQIAHNVEIGYHTVIASQAGISGSTKVGKYCMIGGQAGIVGHIKIADQSKINAQSGVSKEIKIPNSSVTGSPAYDYRASLRSQVSMRNLPSLEKRVQELETIIKKLTNITHNS